MEPSTRTLVHFSHALTYNDLSSEVTRQAKYLLLDYLGVAIAGSQFESSHAVYRMLEQLNSAGPCTVIGTALRTSAQCAALANGTAAHTVELDDTHQGGSIHLGVVMFSTAMACSESLPHVDTALFFSAVVAGFEVAARLGMAVQPKDHYELGFHPTSTCGVFGATVTAAKLMGLDEEKMLSAVGIAGSMAAGSLEFLADGAWTKRLHAGLAAQNGILAASLAAQGFRGPSTIFEGRDGFLSAYSRNPNRELVTQDLGRNFEIMRTSIKPHACCRYMQGPIDALTELATTHNIDPEQIERVEVAVLEAGWPLVCEPQQRKYAPINTVDAQFSMPFGAAVALSCRAAGLNQFSDQMLQSTGIQDLMRKVTMTKDPRIEENFPKEWPARALVILKNGEHIEKYVRFPKGDPENPLSFEELSLKFRSLGSRLFTGSHCDEIIESVNHLNEGNEIHDVWKLTSSCPAVARGI